MQKKPALVALATVILAMLFLGGCKQEAAAPPKQVPQVGIITLEAQPYTLTRELPGRTAPYRVAEVRPQVNGIILKRMFTQGTDVKEGQQLYLINPAPYEAAYLEAKANLAATKPLSDRYAQLIKDQAVSRQDYDQAKAATLQAEAKLKRAEIDLVYTKVLAPISGRIGRTAITEGALVTNGQAEPLATINQLDPIYVDVTQAARELITLRRDLVSGRLEKAGENAAKVSLTLEDGSEYLYEGKLEFSEVSVDPSTGMVTLRALFPNPDKILLPGMFVHARLLSGVKSSAILAPQQGITRNLKGEAVAMLVNAENKVEQRVVKAELAVGNRWLVSEGLNPGDRLITEGLQFIRPGVEVKAVPATNVGQGPQEATAQRQGQEG